MDLDDIQLPEDFSAITDDQLNELESAARFAAAPLAERVAKGEDLDEDDLDTVIRLGEVVDGVAGERTKRIEKAADSAAKKGDAARAVATLTDPARPSVAQVASASGSSPAKAATAVAEAVTKPESYTTIVAAAGAPGRTTGQVFENWDEIGKSLEEAMAAFGSNAGSTTRMRTPVVQFRREYPEELRIGAKDSAKTVEDKLQYAADPARIGGQEALVAAAGWCAPSQILYDLYEIENGTFGMVDVPEMQVSRGGIQYTPGPDFSAIWGGAGYWHQTEAMVQAATSKPTMVVPCPSFTNTRLEVDGVAITGAFLQDRGYPEMVARFGRGAMIAHARRMNALKLNYITDGSTLKDYTLSANLPLTTSEGKDLTTVSRLLAIYGWQAMDYRYRFRMAGDALLDAVLPFWVLEAAAEDIARRWVADIDDAMTFTLDEFTRYFTSKHIRMQWVYDWQDAYNLPKATFGTNFFNTDTSTNVGTSVGGNQLWTVPRTVYGLLFAPGTWVAGVSDVIKLDTVYDSTNLALNQYIQLFTEEGILMAKRGYESRLLKMTIDPSGTYSASSAMVDG